MLKCLKTHPDVHGDDDVTAQILDKRIMPTNSEVSRPSPRVTMSTVNSQCKPRVELDAQYP